MDRPHAQTPATHSQTASGASRAPVPVSRSRPTPASPVAPFIAAAAFAVVTILSIGLLLAGSGHVRGVEAAPELRSAGTIGLFLVMTLGPIAWVLFRMVGSRGNTHIRRSLDLLTDSVRRLDESAALSDDARRIVNRRAEREMLCRAIEEDIQSEAWDAAIVLCNELSERFGYRADAEEFRSRIELARAEIFERRVADSIARLDGLVVQRRWDVALQEAARIGRLFPESPRVENLKRRVEHARDSYKQDLERRFLETAHNERIDEAMGLLKELDAYLSENEAEPFREVARGVVTKARENLGAQFKLAVQNKEWKVAAMFGRRITAEFPNTRMAQEVRSMWDGILARANNSSTSAEVSSQELSEFAR